MPACSRCGSTLSGVARGLCPGCLLRLASLPEVLAPEYEIETLLGSGRAGTTYLARAEGTGSLLAVKIVAVRDARSDPQAIAEAVQRELTPFSHPGVARTYAVDVDDEGNARLVRDYVAGKPLSAWVAQADASARELAFDAVASALAAVHSHGLFHGHVAASNIIVAPGGRPMLVDLGAGMVLRALQGAPAAAAEMAAADLAGLEVIRSELSGSR